MIDFYTDGSTVGVALSGWTSVLLIVYIGFEFANWTLTRMLFISKIFLYFRLRKFVKSIIPYWWSIEKISIIGMQKMSGKHIEVPVKVCYKKPGVNETYTAADYLIIKNNKNVSCGSLLNIIDGFDKANGIDKVQMKRDKALKDLGV